MTRYSLTICASDYDRLREHLGSVPGIEQAAYLVCRVARSEPETCLLVREVIPVLADDIVEADADHMIIRSRSFTRAMKRADDQRACFVFVHSHPNGYRDHSPADDETEASLFRTAYIRIRTPGVHGSLVFTLSGLSAARVWLPDGTTAPIERARIVGARLRYWFPTGPREAIPEFFDRQVRAFGSDIQVLLGRLHLGVVGAGGTGSCVAEQLIRLGVGSLVVADGERFERSNVNRVYGSRAIDDEIPKVKLIERLAADIGLNTKVRIIDRPVSYRSVLEEFRHCDAIFGCTDDEWGRSLLTKLAIYYCVPVFDMGVRIDSHEGIIRSIQGRVTTLLPGTACLFCRGRISAQRIRAESLHATNPEQAAALIEEGYIPELGDPAPSVIPFTTTIAASAISEFLHRLTGFLGQDRQSSEVLHLMDDSRVRTNHRSPNEECFCGDRTYWARGDVEPFLDTTWRPE